MSSKNCFSYGLKTFSLILFGSIKSPPIPSAVLCLEAVIIYEAIFPLIISFTVSDFCLNKFFTSVNFLRAMFLAFFVFACFTFFSNSLIVCLSKSLSTSSSVGTGAINLGKSSVLTTSGSVIG